MKKTLLITFILLIGSGIVGYNLKLRNQIIKIVRTAEPMVSKPDVSSKINEAVTFVNKKKMNKEMAILINYHLHSGLKRGYIIDLKSKKATDSFMVSHGCGSSAWGQDFSKNSPQFSNEPESHCSSLGKYKIGERGYSNWGINVKYLMHGLEKTNSNALKRTIVLHGWDDVPENEVHPGGTIEGWGCPAVSNACMTKLDSLLKKQKNVLLWTY